MYVCIYTIPIYTYEIYFLSLFCKIHFLHGKLCEFGTTNFFVFMPPSCFMVWYKLCMVILILTDTKFVFSFCPV